LKLCRCGTEESFLGSSYRGGKECGVMYHVTAPRVDVIGAQIESCYERIVAHLAMRGFPFSPNAGRNIAGAVERGKGRNEWGKYSTDDAHPFIAINIYDKYSTDSRPPLACTVRYCTVCISSIRGCQICSDQTLSTPILRHYSCTYAPNTSWE
jgi:hypothetical protein